MKLCCKCQKRQVRICKGKEQSYCKLCNAEINTLAYKANRASFLEKYRKIREELAELVNDHKCKPCADCAIVYPPYVMDFDHREPKFKVKSVSAMVNGRFNKEKILLEISKCDLVCSNCHRVREYNRRVNPIGDGSCLESSRA